MTPHFRRFRLFLLCIGLAACLPHTSYVPKPGNAALGMKRGRIALIKDGDVAELDRFEAVMACEPNVAALARTASESFRTAERNQQIAGMINALVVIFPLAPAVGVPFAIKAVKADQAARAALVDAVNRHNDVAVCVRKSGPGSVIGEVR